MERGEYAIGFSRCICNIEANLRTAWTGSNPGRRLHGCRNYGWYDDPFLLRATQVISGLLRRIDRHDLDLQAARGKERKWMYIALCLALYIVVEKVFIR
ncbi:uncharacterized protein LOC110650697 isoform X2 [Hevea brasiliensis]|uniref:uncharacterized protein LOC110650697 isoform X2 n=1 Tax=Hevea brasiliensis TaxID=3981 RepID=UPI000B76B998|nr:uncharacterized protein LOC110650697 isoform X2 [Hevea brasiliensis]